MRKQELEHWSKMMIKTNKNLQTFQKGPYKGRRKTNDSCGQANWQKNRSERVKMVLKG